MKNLIKTFIFALAMCMFTSAYSQVATQPAQPPWYFYWPTENPDNFEYSELGRSSLGGGNTFRRKSNVEVNKKAGDQEEITSLPAPDPSTAIDVEIGAAENSFNARPGGSTEMYKWVDDDKVVHVTNEIGSIPEKYRDQVEN